jgi:hypothetical protein
MPGDMTVRALKASPWAKLLDRPLVKPVVAAGGGVLRRADMAALAEGEALLAPDHEVYRGPAAAAALDAATAEWHDYEITLSEWGVGRRPEYAQLSRAGGNLVVQLGMPSGHMAIMARHIDPADRWKYEDDFHPIRTEGRPTLAWVRLDIDLGSGVALIEEVQSDWIRNVENELHDLRYSDARSHELRSLQAYHAALIGAYAKSWPRVALLAALMLLRDRLGIREVWMHQPEMGRVLKHIDFDGPPRSLYSDLPRRFAMRPVKALPMMLQPRHGRVPRVARRASGPLMWRLDI